MSNQHPTSNLIFTLEGSILKAESQEQTQQKEFDWERGLEQLREKRQAPLQVEVDLVDTHIAAVKPVCQHETVLQESSHSLDAAAREKVLREYLLQWQQEHNEALEEQMSLEETDTTVLLQEDWLNAQAALRTAADEQVLETHTVWLNPKRGTEQVKSEVGGTDLNQEENSEDLFNAPGQVSATVQVINPQVVPELPVMCLSEQELMERLVKRLRPHLTDAVSGMVRTAVQKQTAALTYQLQQRLNEQTPALIDEILEYNLKTVMSEIRYDLKFKRKPR